MTTERKNKPTTFGEQFMQQYLPKMDPIPIIQRDKPKYDEEVYNKLMRNGKHYEAKLFASGQTSEALRSLLDDLEK